MGDEAFDSVAETPARQGDSNNSPRSPVADAYRVQEPSGDIAGGDGGFHGEDNWEPQSFPSRPPGNSTAVPHDFDDDDEYAGHSQEPAGRPDGRVIRYLVLRRYRTLAIVTACIQILVGFAFFASPLWWMGLLTMVYGPIGIVFIWKLWRPGVMIYLLCVVASGILTSLLPIALVAVGSINVFVFFMLFCICPIKGVELLILTILYTRIPTKRQGGYHALQQSYRRHRTGTGMPGLPGGLPGHARAFTEAPVDVYSEVRHDQRDRDNDRLPGAGPGGYQYSRGAARQAAERKPPAPALADDDFNVGFYDNNATGYSADPGQSPNSEQRRQDSSGSDGLGHDNGQPLPQDKNSHTDMSI